MRLKFSFNINKKMQNNNSIISNIPITVHKNLTKLYRVCPNRQILILT